MLSWSDHRYGSVALGAVAFAESSFFPVPPDVLLISLGLGRPRRSLWYGLICTALSVAGGMFGYFVGLALFESLGQRILEFYGAMDEYVQVGRLYRENLVVALGAAGFTPIPYKVFTIAAGAFAIPLVPFVIISAVSRGARFFLVAGLLYLHGERVRSWIERYFSLFTILFFVLLLGGFVLVRWVL
ncbi:MAG: DedA family protein [Gemmatimonadetes bacterium]|nr:DedA family protein [Gemmatimonadota bacterium]